MRSQIGELISQILDFGAQLGEYEIRDAAVRVARNLQTTRASLVDDVQLLRQQLGLPAVAG